MAQKKINYGAAPNDGTGDLYRVAMIKIDDNFTDLYALAGGLENNKVAKSTTLALSGGATAAATALNGSAITLDITSLDMSKASGTLAVAHGGTGVTTSTGTGANVQADSPALVGTPTTPLPGAGAADDQVANVKYVKDGLSFKANAADVTTALALKADKLYVDTKLALKVDKDGNKVLSDNNFTNAERQKLEGIAAGAQVNAPTNLALGAATANSRTITSSTGSSVTLPAASSSTAGLMASAEAVKLSTVATNASANSSDAFLLNRANHSGSQAIGTVSGLTDALRGMRNKIINGGFQINQRAYVSGAATSAGQYTLDRWRVTGVGGITFSTVENKCTVTIPAGQTLQQVIEGLNLQTGNYVLSWEGTAKGRVGAGAYGNSGAVTVAIVGGTNTTIEFNAGTVANVQFEAGVVVTPFEQRFIGTEIALCKRYYELGFLSVCSDGVMSYTRATTQMSETKRATPTFIVMDSAGNYGKCTADAENNIPAQVSGSANFVAFNVNNVVKGVNVFFGCNWFAIAEL